MRGDLMRLTVYMLYAFLLILLVGCGQVSTSTNAQNKLGELYVATIIDASDWQSKPTFLAITEQSFSYVDDQTKDWIIKKLEETYDEVYIFENIKNDQDKFEYEILNGKETLVNVIDGMTIDVEIEQYEETKATVSVAASRGTGVGVIPTYNARFKDGVWEIEKMVQAEI
jgi:uncharacterized protein YceK